MSKVALDEPEGYRGHRRRFLLPFTRKAGGAALPALLVAASIVVVLIVVGVSQLLPRQAAGQIPIGPGNAGGNGGQGDNGDGQPADPGSTDGPIGSGSPRPGKTGTAKPLNPLVTGAVTPTSTQTALTPTTNTPTTNPPPPFTPMALEGEAATGGSAKPGTCNGCSGGSKVRFIGRNTGWVTFTGIPVPATMDLRITVVYVCGTCTRTFYISINGGAPMTLTPPPTADWNTTNSVFLTVTMPAGSDSIRFYNPNTTADAPDLDRIQIRSP